MKKALFAGSFDPFTLGHLDVLQQGKRVFDQITLLISVSPDKNSLLTTQERVEMLELLFAADSQVKVDSCPDIVVDYAKANGYGFLIRGVRNANDLIVEQQLAEANKVLSPDTQTVIFMCDPKLQFISSSYVREFLKYKKDIGPLVPIEIKEYISKKG